MTHRSTSIAAVLTMLLVSGCPEDPVTPPKPVSTVSTATPVPTPKPSATPKPAPSTSASPVAPLATLTGRVELAAVPGESFKDNAVAFRVLAVPAGKAVITLSTLEDGLLTPNVQGTTTDAEGRFTIPGPLPTQPYVVHAALARNHRLSAIVLPDVAEVTIDEASSMAAAMARFQVRNSPPASGPEEGRKTLEDLKFEVLRVILTETRKLVSPDDFPVSGDAPVVAALQSGATAALRNLYVAKFGSRTVTLGTTDGNRLSDAWRSLLGYRTVGVSRFAGSGAATGTEGAPAREGELVTPISAVEDGEGTVYISERDNHRIRIVPKAALTPRLAATQSMSAGNLYTLAGTLDGPKTLAAYNTLYQAAEQAAVTNAAAAPQVFDTATQKAYPLLTPYRLLLDKAVTGSHLFFTSSAGHRVMLIPATNFSRYGRQFEAGRLYTIAGTGAATAAASEAELGHNGPARSARLHVPTGLSKDRQGNLYVLDAGAANTVNHGLVRIIRATDGRILNFPLLKGGQPFRVAGAQDLRVVEVGAERFLYVADTLRHFVFRVPLPASLTAVTATEIQVVLGVPEVAGTVDSTKGQLPDQLGQAAGVAKEAIQMSGPTSLEFDAAGNMVVADTGNGRVLALEKAGLTGAGKVHVIGGAFKAEGLVGDARLLDFAGSAYLSRDTSGNLLLPDTTANTVRKLWTARGTF